MDTRYARPEGRVVALAAGQHSVVSRGQAMGAGLTDEQIARRVASGEWRRVRRGIYLVGAVAPGYLQDLAAAVLAGGPDAVASHRAAGVLHALDGVRGRVLELTLPRTRRRRLDGCVVHHADIAPDDVTVVQGVPTTAPARTLIDLASVLPPRTLGLALDDALRRRLVTMRQIRHRLDELAGRGRRGCIALRRELDLRTDENDVTDSGGERLLLEAVREAGLPEPVLHHLVKDDGFAAEIDLAWPRYRVGVELEGRAYHFGRAKRTSDIARSNELKLRGWLVLDALYADVRDPRGLMSRLGTALRNSGWVIPV